MPEERDAEKSFTLLHATTRRRRLLEEEKEKGRTRHRATVLSSQNRRTTFNFC